jgi:ABC-2 type transport system permease protein
MDPRRVAAVALRLAAQFRRDRRTLALMFVAPIIILTLLGSLMRLSSSASPTVGVVNQDRGPIGGAEARFLQDSRGFRALANLAEGEGLMSTQKLDGYVVFPPTFTDDATKLHRFTVQLRIEGGAQSTRPYLQQQVGAASVIAYLATQAKLPPVPTEAARVTYLHGSSRLDALDYLGAAFIGVTVFFLVFVVTSVVFLRERTGGTLERLMASPISRGELVLGYMVALGTLTLIQSLVVLTFALSIIHIHSQGSPVLVLVFTALIGLGAANLGIFVSVFSRSEFQAVQFVPVVVAPQIFLAGLIFPVDSEPWPLRIISDILPLTYGIRGLRDVMIKGSGIGSGEVLRDLFILLVFAALALAAAGQSLRRRVD